MKSTVLKMLLSEYRTGQDKFREHVKTLFPVGKHVFFPCGRGYAELEVLEYPPHYLDPFELYCRNVRTGNYRNVRASQVLEESNA